MRLTKRLFLQASMFLDDGREIVSTFLNNIKSGAVYFV